MSLSAANEMQTLQLLSIHTEECGEEQVHCRWILCYMRLVQCQEVEYLITKEVAREGSCREPHVP